MGVLDLLALNVGLLWALSLRPQYGFAFDLVFKHPHWFGILSFLWLLWAWAFDAYDIRTTARFKNSARAIALATVVAVGIFLLIPYVTPPLPVRRSLLLPLPFLPLGLLLLGRGFYSAVLRQPIFVRRVLILGTGWAGETILEALRENGGETFRIIGFIDDDPRKQNQNINGYPVLGGRYQLKDLISEHQANTIVVAVPEEVDGELLQILMDCLELGIEIIPMPLLYEQLTGRVPVQFVGNSWYVAMPLDHPLTKPLNQAIKRMFDVVAASLGLAILAPFFPLIALAIYLDSPGPIFYTQWRVGRGGKPFKLYKFRSMVPDAEKERPVWARERDPRITRVGRVLRKTHLDEFPQLLNILKGDMSAVGPRPERPEFVEELSKEIPFFRVRHAVKPGMAGWGLVKYGYASSREDSLHKLQYDLYYIKHWSLWLDMVILLKTVIDAITFRGR